MMGDEKKSLRESICDCSPDHGLDYPINNSPDATTKKNGERGFFLLFYRVYSNDFGSTFLSRLLAF